MKILEEKEITKCVERALRAFGVGTMQKQGKVWVPVPGEEVGKLPAKSRGAGKGWFPHHIAFCLGVHPCPVLKVSEGMLCLTCEFRALCRTVPLGRGPELSCDAED